MLKRWVLLMAQIHKNVVITGKNLDPAETICAHNILHPPSVQYQNEKRPKSQTRLRFHEILHLREPLVGSIAFFHFVTEQGRAS